MRIHLRPLSLQEVVSSLSREQRRLMRHLIACESCRRSVGALLDQPGSLAESLAEVLPWPGQAEPDYGRAITAAEERACAHARALAAERAAAGGRLGELMEQPPERREMMIRNHARFQTWGVLERLIEHAREQCLTAPPSAEGFAQLAVSLANVLDPEFYGADRIEDLRARAWGFVGNARRIRLDLKGAEEAFETAFLHLQRGTGDVLERALLLDLRASLCRAERRLEEAERLLVRAFRIYRQVGEKNRMARVLLNMTNVNEVAGRPERSIPLLFEALKLIDGEWEPRLLWSVHHNLIWALAESGRFMEAQGLFIHARPLYARFADGHARSRRRWVAGKIARGLGQTREAEAQLQAAREGFLVEGRDYDAMVVSLDLAALYAEQGRTAELKQAAQELLAVFSSKGIHREALAALSLLHQATLTEQASLEIISGVASQLKRIRHESEQAKLAENS